MSRYQGGEENPVPGERESTVEVIAALRARVAELEKALIAMRNVLPDYRNEVEAMTLADAALKGCDA